MKEPERKLKEGSTVKGLKFGGHSRLAHMHLLHIPFIFKTLLHKAS